TVRPVITQGPYGYTQGVNVAAQRADSASLLNLITRFAHLRKQCPEIGWSHWKLLDTGSEAVVAIQYDWQDRSVLVVYNFSPDPQPCQLTTSLRPNSRLTDLLNHTENRPTTDGRFTVQLPGYGYKWYRLKK
ncbi:MAG: alpha-glucosidase C-terminal domain-containing protein, partial [Williamsia sp.]|nr:alpha-glucosidase C-terminal domain-containing protein [Williamsia sp.]